MIVNYETCESEHCYGEKSILSNDSSNPYFVSEEIINDLMIAIAIFISNNED